MIDVSVRCNGSVGSRSIAFSCPIIFLNRIGGVLRGRPAIFGVFTMPMEDDSSG